MNKIKLFFTSILGIKVFASILFGAIACALITVCISASFALAGIVVGFWIDEVIYLIFKSCKKTPSDENEGLLEQLAKQGE